MIVLFKRLAPLKVLSPHIGFTVFTVFFFIKEFIHKLSSYKNIVVAVDGL